MNFRIKRTKADAVFSEYIRRKADWTCERCLRDFRDNKRNFHVSHYWSRGNRSVRFDEENVAALCFACHHRFTKNPGEHRDFFVKRLGQKKYDALEVRAKTPRKVDEKIVALMFEMLLKDLGKPLAFRDNLRFKKKGI